MSAAALRAAYNSRELLFVVAQRWWSMCSCGGRVLYNVNESKTGGRGEKEFFFVALRVSVRPNKNVQSWIPPLKYVATERSRGRRGGGSKVKQRLNWEGGRPPLRGEWARRLMVSSSSLNHHHPSPCPPSSSPLLALFHHFAVRPPSLSRQLLRDLLRVTQLLYKLPSHLLTGVWGHFCKFVSRSLLNKTLHSDLKRPETCQIQTKVEWSQNKEPQWHLKRSACPLTVQIQGLTVNTHQHLGSSAWIKTNYFSVRLLRMWGDSRFLRF